MFKQAPTLTPPTQVFNGSSPRHDISKPIDNDLISMNFTASLKALAEFKDTIPGGEKLSASISAEAENERHEAVSTPGIYQGFPRVYPNLPLDHVNGTLTSLAQIQAKQNNSEWIDVARLVTDHTRIQAGLRAFIAEYKPQSLEPLSNKVRERSAEVKLAYLLLNPENRESRLVLITDLRDNNLLLRTAENILLALNRDRANNKRELDSFATSHIGKINFGSFEKLVRLAAGEDFEKLKLEAPL